MSVVDPDTWVRCLGLDDPEDVVFANHMVDVLRPFIVHLQADYSFTTLRRHCEGLSMLLATLADRRVTARDCGTLDPSMTAEACIREAIDDEGGPMIRGRYDEWGQGALDASCRALHRYFREIEAGSGHRLHAALSV